MRYFYPVYMIYANMAGFRWAGYILHVSLLVNDVVMLYLFYLILFSVAEIMTYNLLEIPVKR